MQSNLPGQAAKRGWMCAAAAAGVLLFALLKAGVAAPQPEPLRFAILGDRTGEAMAGVYEQVWKEVAAEDPAFVVSVGDTIEGMHDETARAEWEQVQRTLAPYRRFTLYAAPGNHDIWSEASEKLFRQYAGHPPHYSFDRGRVHVTVLDNSRSDQLAPEELAFLEDDLSAHAAQPVKLIVSHRPSWLVGVALRNSELPLHRIARRYGVQYVIAGHVHQLLRLSLDGVTYISMPSAGGHLRLSGAYEDGWFFGHVLATVQGDQISVEIKEVNAPHGQGRVSTPAAWGMFGLLARPAAAGAATSEK